MFCKYEDYNWDWSIMHVNVKCLPRRFKTLFTKSPRILHIGDCGVHTHRCDANKAYQTAKDLFLKHEKALFPKELSVTDVSLVLKLELSFQVSRRSLKPSKENGGWGDTRDHALCRLNTFPLNWRQQDYSVLHDLLHSSVVVPNLESHTGLWVSSPKLPHLLSRWPILPLYAQCIASRVSSFHFDAHFVINTSVAGLFNENSNFDCGYRILEIVDWMRMIELELLCTSWNFP